MSCAPSAKAQRECLERLAALPDSPIDTTDIPEVHNWSGTSRGGLDKPRKEIITICLDADVLAYFRSRAEGGEGYQDEINRVLRQHVRRAAKAQKRA